MPTIASIYGEVSCLIVTMSTSDNSAIYYFYYIFVGIYFTVKIAFQFPHYIHKRKRLGRKGFAEIIAHRGSRIEGLPENTISAFRAAAAAEAHIIELDVWLSKDGKVVVHHDEDFTRMTKGENSQKIHQTQYCDFPLIKPRFPLLCSSS